MRLDNTAGMQGRCGASDINIGRFTYGHERLHVLEWGEGAALHIGSFCSISDKVVCLLGGNHHPEWVTTFPFGQIFTAEFGGREITGQPATKGDIRIGHDVWIGTAATILSGVTIGDGAVMGKLRWWDLDVAQIRSIAVQLAAPLDRGTIEHWLSVFERL